ncbi:MAG: hypothetical protein KDA87_01610 [Planctomycetales bacterium]|nr:hypothetical protein [Planctomycetales bacterium]
MKRFEFRLDRLLALRESQKRMVEQEIARNLRNQRDVREQKQQVIAQWQQAMRSVRADQIDTLQPLCDQHQQQVRELDQKLQALQVSLQQIQQRRISLERQVDSYGRLREDAWSDYLKEYESETQLERDERAIRGWDKRPSA